MDTDTTTVPPAPPAPGRTNGNAPRTKQRGGPKAADPIRLADAIRRVLTGVAPVGRDATLAAVESVMFNPAALALITDSRKLGPITRTGWDEAVAYAHKALANG